MECSQEEREYLNSLGFVYVWSGSTLNPLDCYVLNLEELIITISKAVKFHPWRGEILKNGLLIMSVYESSVEEVITKLMS